MYTGEPRRRIIISRVWVRVIQVADTGLTNRISVPISRRIRFLSEGWHGSGMFSFNL